MVCQKLCQKSVSGRGSLEESSDCVFFLCVCVSRFRIYSHQVSVWVGYLWWGAPSDFKHVTHTRFVIFEIRYPCHPWFPFGFLKQRLTLACAP